MDAKYETRKQELLDECTVAPQIFDRVMPRLEQFMDPFVESLARKEQYEHASTFIQGLLSDLDHKNVESIAYRFGQERMPLQMFIGQSGWDHKPLRDELVRQVGEQLGDENGVIVFDPSGFQKSGTESVGVGRQWCGRLGKIDNCQVAIYMGYVSAKEHALVDTRLFLPKDWTKDKQRREKAGVPKEIRYRTRHQLCLEMLAQHGEILPHAWVAGDDEMGRPSWFRRRLDVLAFLKKNHSAYVGEITKEIGISMQALSKHLKQLADANIVTSKKRGLYVTYRLFVPQSSIVRKVLQEL